jgi:hypothetical protein
MLFTRAQNTFTSEKMTLLACGLLAMMILPVNAQNAVKDASAVESSKQLNKERKKEEKEEKSEKSIEKADKTAEKEAEAAQAREKSLPAHEDHHKLGDHNRVDKGFDFNSSSKSP